MPLGLWSSPDITGQRSPPCGAFTFTRVDKKRGVMFGGWQEETRRNVAGTFILNFETWVCSHV